MKLSEAIKEFRDWRSFKVTGHTIVRYDSALKIFCLTMRDPEIESIQPGDVLDYLMNMERLGWKRNGIVINCLALRILFKYLNLKGVKCFHEELIPLPRKEFNIPRVANAKDLKTLESSIPRDSNPNNIRNLALVHMVWDTWARSGEIVSLNIDDLKFYRNGTGSATIKTEKSRGRRPIREIFWTAETTKYLKKWLETKARLERQFMFMDQQAVFVSICKCGQYDVRGRRMTSRGVAEVFRTNSNRANLPTIFNAHSARHYGGRHIIEKGGSSADVSNILGHSHQDSSYIYTMLWGKDLQKRYNHFQMKNK